MSDRKGLERPSLSVPVDRSKPARRLLGAALVLGGSFLGIGGGWVLFRPILHLLSGASGPESFLGVSSKPILILFVAAGGWAFNYGARFLAPSASEAVAKDPRQPVILLRSFGDDELPNPMTKGGPEILASTFTMGRHRGTTLEEALVELFSDVGPVLAVSTPGRNTPPLGAARAKLADDEWQEQVVGWISRSRYILVVLGTTTGLNWELQRIVEAGQPGKVFLFFPPLKGSMEERWRTFRSTLGDSLKGLPDSVPGNAIGARFLADWSCEFIPAPPFGVTLRHTLTSIVPGIRTEWAMAKSRLIVALLLVMALVIFMHLMRWIETL